MNILLFVYSPVGLLLLSLLATLGSSASEITFDNDLEGFRANRGIWKWSDRASVGWTLPDGGDGFAVYSKPGEGDELYSNFIPLDYGLNYTITYFTASRWPASTTFSIGKLRAGGAYLETVQDLTTNSSPYNTKWMTASGYIEPGPATLFSLFCQSNDHNPDVDTGYLWGCAIDSMVLNMGSDQSTTTTEATNTSAEATTTTAEATTRTSEAMTTTAEAPTTTAEATTTTAEATTRTFEAMTTTAEATTATAEPSSTIYHN